MFFPPSIDPFSLASHLIGKVEILSGKFIDVECNQLFLASCLTTGQVIPPRIQLSTELLHIVALCQFAFPYWLSLHFISVTPVSHSHSGIWPSGTDEATSGCPRGATSATSAGA